MFYMSDKDLWRWKMNIARAMGNSRDDEYLPDLLTAFRNNDDERVLGMMAWAIGRIGGSKAKKALNDLLPRSDGSVREEILFALEKS
jgi:epoxyqueuosine reductase